MRRRLLCLLALAGLVGCGGQSGSASSGSGGFAIIGQVDTFNSQLGPAGKACTASGWQFNLMRGTQVVVSSPTGAKVGLGRLGPGVGDQLGCRFPFTVVGVPEGFKLYTVQVAGRQSQTFSRARLSRKIVFSFM